jgi:very-short-patch-repair endonuclease
MRSSWNWPVARESGRSGMPDRPFLHPPQLVGEVAAAPAADGGGRRSPRELRQGMSLPEVLLWRQLRQRPRGLKFRRQHRVPPYTLDFFCAQHRLAVEVDGFAHDCGDRPLRDVRRDQRLHEAGIAVLRVPAGEVFADPVETAESVARYAVALSQWFVSTERRRACPPTRCAGHLPNELGRMCQISFGEEFANAVGRLSRRMHGRQVSLSCRHRNLAAR